MDNIESLNHTKWDCKYHVVFIPTILCFHLVGYIPHPLGRSPCGETAVSRVASGT
jgi:hypothetical protein